MKQFKVAIFATGCLIFLILTSFRSVPDSHGWDETISWSSARKLTWSDFRGEPDLSTSMRAIAYTTIRYEFVCNREDLEAKVICEFVPEQSWVKKNPSNEMLQHEQLHFDISELFSRKLRKRFAELSEQCYKGRAYIDNEAKLIFNEWHAMQKLYDSETEHSLNRENQKAWTLKVRNALAQLSQFATQ